MPVPGTFRAGFTLISFGPDLCFGVFTVALGSIPERRCGSGYVSLGFVPLEDYVVHSSLVLRAVTAKSFLFLFLIPSVKQMNS